LYAQLVKKELADAGLPVFNTSSHIVPVMVGDSVAAYEISDRLLREHFIYIQAINYPTVERGTERLRIVPNPHHTPTMIENMIVSLVGVWKEIGMPLKV